MKMTLDVAIKHCEEKAKELREKAGFIQDQKEIDDCCECAEEHAKLAEWLKELKDYRKLFDSPKEAEEILNMMSV